MSINNDNGNANPSVGMPSQDNKTSLKDRVYAATNQGLDILKDQVPALNNLVIDRSKKPPKFKFRPEEKHPSACLYPPNGKYQYWRMADYGISNHTMSPIAVYMYNRNMDTNNPDNFKQALRELADKYGVKNDNYTTYTPKPEWIDRAANPGEEEGQYVYKKRETFTQGEISYWGKNVKEEHLRKMGWAPLEYIGKVKEGMVKEFHSSPQFPIFIQTCPHTDKTTGERKEFYKIYKPYADKEHRFFYIKKKPNDYIWGLELVQEEVRKNDGKKLNKIAIVSGGSDAVNCLSMGMTPVYFNSETADFSETQHKLLLEYAENIYYIGDIDPTGIKCTSKIAQNFPDIYIAELPMSLLKYTNRRGNQCKDLKDYLELHPNREAFWNLIHKAKRCKFWEEKQDKDGNVKGYNMSPTYMAYLLKLNGFYTLKDDNQEGRQYIRIENHKKVKSIKLKDIETFANNWSCEKALSKDIQDAMVKNRDLLPNANKCKLTEVDLDFTSCTEYLQRIFFNNYMVEVTPEETKQYRYEETSAKDIYVWEDKILPHDYKAQKQMFTIETYEDGSLGAVLTEEGERCDVLRILRNTSRMYWRQEDEMNIPLNEQQQQEERRNLASKLFALGYCLHHYRLPSKSWALVLMDAHPSENEKQCNGGSGKSFFMRCLENMVGKTNVVWKELINKAKSQERFFDADVTKKTNLILVDECAKDVNLKDFFAKITGNYSIDPKMKTPFSIDAEHAPKMVFATNHLIMQDDDSTLRRIWPLVFSDYYHHKSSSNDYLEERTIADDTGYQVFSSSYPEEKWQLYGAMAIQCLQLFMATPEKVVPPMKAIEQRKLNANMDEDLADWADEYLAPRNGRLNVEISLKTAFNNYEHVTGINEDKKGALKRFKNKLKVYCKAKGLIFNPTNIISGYVGYDKDRNRVRRDRVEYIFIATQEGCLSTSDTASPETEQLAPLPQNPFKEAMGLDDGSPF